MKPKKINYLSNSHLLKEVAASKLNYCSYMDEADSLYDEIVDEMKGLAKAKPESQIVRVMTYEHVPSGKSRAKKGNAKNHVAVNFPPFQHFRRQPDGTWRCVLKSHWVGGLENGHFDAEHAQMTRKLAEAIMLLARRYRNRGNWRGYSYADEMEANAILQLTQNCLKFDENKSANVFAFWTTIVNNSFRRTWNVEAKNQEIRDDILEAASMSPSLSRQINNELNRGSE